VKQQYARRKGVGIASLSWEFLVTQSMHDTSINLPPSDGAYVKDLFIEGARWDVEAGTLEDAFAMELICPMPIIQFKPTQSRKSQKGLHKTPLYIYPIRTGTRERPSFMLEVDLKAGANDSSYWTKRGTALLLSLGD
jgi:dynein heavy chain